MRCAVLERRAFLRGTFSGSRGQVLRRSSDASRPSLMLELAGSKRLSGGSNTIEASI